MDQKLYMIGKKITRLLPTKIYFVDEMNKFNGKIYLKQLFINHKK